MTADLPHFVYLFWQDESCLYVGCTAHPATRLKQHSWTKSWWNRVTKIEMHRFAGKTEARAHEKQLIETLQPSGNSVWTSHFATAGGHATRKWHNEKGPCPFPSCHLAMCLKYRETLAESG